jgi:tetratricopeptide (TPR) repeat protein
MKVEPSLAARFNLAMTALNSGRESLAIGIFKDLIELRPGFTEAYLAMGVAHGKLDDFEEMVETFMQAIRLDRAAVRRQVHVMVSNTQRLPDDEITYADVSGQMVEFVRELDEARALVGRAAEDLLRGRDLAAIKALERSLSIAYPYQLGMIVMTIAYLLIETMVPGGAAQVGEKSVLKEIEPRLATHLFG